jgi:outer membrane murein-binding lipoprotein Lpp
MKRIETGLFICAVAFIAFGLSGCDGTADENKPISDVQAEAAKMNAEQLRSMAMKYKDAIAAKMTEVDKVMAKLKEIPTPAQMPGKEASQAKQEFEALSKSLKALKTRFDVYYNKLKEKGEDVSQLGI